MDFGDEPAGLLSVSYAHRWGFLATTAYLAVACGAADTPPLPWEPTPFPIVDEDPPAQQVALGRLLFYDPALSVDEATTCGTCHSEFWGMSDRLAQGIGHGAGRLAGPGRVGPNVLRRNSQALWNLAFRQTLLWDGRTATLEAQALLPLRADDELARPPEELVGDLAAINEYAELFAEAFPSDPRVTVDNIASALAAFQRTLVSNRSLYDGYVAGDVGALSPDMVEGMFRFAELGCGDCHTQPLFESEAFFNRNVPDLGIVDDGRFEATEDPADRDHFRVPTLRNVSFTEPYFHNGVFFDLEEAVRHELEQGKLPFDDDDVRLITIFIDQALRDESREPTRPEEVPSGLPMPLDGTLITR